MSNVKADIRSFLVDNFIYDEARLPGDSASLMEAGVIDSTGVLELIMFLEKQYLITVKDDELLPENLDTVDNISRYVAGKLGGGPGTAILATIAAAGETKEGVVS